MLLGSGTLLNISSKCSREVFPATLISGLGLLQVCGRIRVPQPAIGIKILKVSLIPQFYRVNAQGHNRESPEKLLYPGLSEIYECPKTGCGLYGSSSCLI